MWVFQGDIPTIGRYKQNGYEVVRWSFRKRKKDGVEFDEPDCPRPADIVTGRANEPVELQGHVLMMLSLEKYSEVYWAGQEQADYASGQVRDPDIAPLQERAGMVDEFNVSVQKLGG